ncbi:MAG TPA: xanthine dehydrogenase family protein subunit M [Xanthobacteraceae bacterium]|jgi:carbon-monoxide dehydrogenase medium subunit|nr:xanthine dehydrogenase family protein subunit M [Xanthobacteraceae bacterium]
MALQPFRLARPKTLAEARALREENDEASFLSGGHTLLPTMKQGLSRPPVLIDLTRIADLRFIKDDGDTVTIGATTLHEMVGSSQVVRGKIPALAGLAGSIGDRHVRNRGTIGGSLANNDPAADYPSAALGLGATVITDRRELIADDYFVHLYETALEPGEIVTRIRFPVPDIAAYAKFRHPASRYSIAAVFISRTADAVRVAVTGAGLRGVFRATEYEAALSKNFHADALEGLSIDSSTMLSDLAATPEYRAHLVHVMAKRAMNNLGTAQSYK